MESLQKKNYLNLYKKELKEKHEIKHYELKRKDYKFETTFRLEEKSFDPAAQIKSVRFRKFRISFFITAF